MQTKKVRKAGWGRIQKTWDEAGEGGSEGRVESLQTGLREGRCCRGTHHEFAEEARHESVCFVPLGLCLDCKPEKSGCLVLSRISCGSRDLAQKNFWKEVLIVFPLCPSESSLRPDSSSSLYHLATGRLVTDRVPWDWRFSAESVTERKVLTNHMQPEGAARVKKRLTVPMLWERGLGDFVKGDSDCFHFRSLEGDLGKWTLYYFALRNWTWD